jgi:acid phosphatase class B
MKNIILCDIDGTVANNDHRQHFLEGKKDWDGFFSELINDKPIYPIIDIVKKEYLDGKKIVFLTGRPEKYRYSTKLWLREYFDFDSEIYMRNNDDKNNKLKVKREIFNLNFNKRQILYCIDNDYDLLKQWEEMGLKIIDANLIK